jgi:hypothetical protein
MGSTPAAARRPPACVNPSDLPRDVFIAALVESIATRGRAQSAGLLSGMLHRFWPGGTADHTSRPAREWLSRWEPKLVDLSPLDCDCAQGRCALCN